jgi:hypothetical protein
MWLEDRGWIFWIFILTVIHVIAAMIAQVNGHADLLNFISEHPYWFAASLFYAAEFLSVVSRIYFPLMLNAPRIYRKERAIINHYKVLTAIGLALGPVLSFSILGTNNLFTIFPVTVFLGFLPLAIMWAYLALVLNENDYEDERTWSFLAELGASERLEHRHHGFILMGTIPVALFIFYLLMNNLWIIFNMKHSILISMFKELWNRATEQ